MLMLLLAGTVGLAGLLVGLAVVGRLIGELLASGIAWLFSRWDTA